MSTWMDKLTVADIPEQYQELARLVGVQNLLKLAAVYGGDRPYIPKREALLRITRDRIIRKQYNGYNSKELARYYGLTPVRIIQICKGKSDTDEEAEETRVPEVPTEVPKTMERSDQYSMWNCF